MKQDFMAGKQGVATMIAVSGTGIAGIAAAVAAQHAGHDVIVIGPSPRTMAGGVQLAPNGWAALDDLGVADAVAAGTIWLNDITVRDLNNLATITRLPLENRYGAVSRQHLHQSLNQALDRGKPGGKALQISRITTPIAAIHQDDTALTVMTEEGENATVTAVIAADGQHGAGRPYVLGEDASRQTSADKVALRAEIPKDMLPAQFSTPSSNLWLGNGMHVVHYPLGESVNLVVTVPARLNKPDVIEHLFAGHAVFAPLANPEIVWARTPLPHASNAVCWRRGDVVLAGDAAHIMPPHLAQGAGQSLEDAACLYRCLTTAEDVPAALSRYAVTRARAVSMVANKANLSGQIMGLGGPAGRLRNMVLDVGGNQLMKGWLADVWAGDQSLARR